MKLARISVSMILLFGALAGCGRQTITRPAAVKVGTTSPTAVSAGSGTYVLKDLGVYSGGTFSSALGISPSGLITGSASKSDGSTYVPILWSGSTMKDLGTLGGTHGNGVAVNNSGVVVGTSYLSGGGWHAFCYSGGKIKDMGKLNGFNSGACGVNATGLVIGTGDVYGGWNRGFTWQVGSTAALKQLSTLGGNSCVATAVNDAGLIVGQSNTKGPDPYSQGGPIHACSWTNGVIKDLGAPSGESSTSQATAVSSNGLIAGWATGLPGNHAVTFSNGTLRDLGSIPGFSSTRATGINSSGTVIGLAANGRYGGNSTRAFVYSGGAIANIHDKVSNLGGWTITQLNAINDAGVIVGVAVVPPNLGYGTHAIQLTPQ